MNNGWQPPNGGGFGQAAPPPPNGMPAPGAGAPQGYPPQGAPQGYPQQGAPQGYPPQGAPQGYPQQGAPNLPAGSDPALAAYSFTTGDPSGGHRYPFIQPGDYKLSVKAVRFKPARSGKQLYIIELNVVESNNPELQAGSICSAFIDLGNVDTRDKHVTGFLAALHGYDPEKMPKESPVAPWVDQQTGRNESWSYYFATSVHESNPFENWKVGCKAIPTKTNAGGDFTLCLWKPFDEMEIGAMQQAASPAPQQFPQAQPQQSPYGTFGGAPQGAPPNGFQPPGPPNGGGYPQQGAPQGQPQGYPPQGAPQGQQYPQQGAPQGQPQGGYPPGPPNGGGWR